VIYACGVNGATRVGIVLRGGIEGLFKIDLVREGIIIWKG